VVATSPFRIVASWKAGADGSWPTVRMDSDGRGVRLTAEEDAWHGRAHSGGCREQACWADDLTPAKGPGRSIPLIARAWAVRGGR